MMAWCVECYTENRKTPATKLLDGDDLCDMHYAAAADGTVPEKPQVATGAQRVCGREGCGKSLTAANKSGYCAKHFYDSRRPLEPKRRGRRPRNSEPAPTTAPATPPDKNWQAFAKTATYQESVKMPPVEILPTSEPEIETVTVKVTAKSLDLIWSRLSLPERASLLFPSGGEA